MFTGIISHIGKVAHIEKSGDWRITIAAGGFAQDADIGASIACSGACLTVIEKDADGFVVQASLETLKRTTLGAWLEGASVNLERALKVGDELGGHFVSGHVDGLAQLKERSVAGDSWKLVFEAPSLLKSFIASKGSVTLDGVSLTVNEINDSEFSVNIIPHTLQSTTLGAVTPGDSVNLEIDLIARYLARLVEA